MIDDSHAITTCSVPYCEAGIADRLSRLRSVHQIDTLRTERATLITYLRQRTDRCDWHGVMDASADIREIEAKLSALGAAW